MKGWLDNPFFMTKARHRREFASLSKTYRRELEAANYTARSAVEELARERKRWTEIINKLTRYEDDDGTHQLVSVDGEALENIPTRMMTIVPHYDRDCVTFHFSVTNFLIKRVRDSLNEQDGYHLRKLVQGEVERGLFTMFVEKVLNRGL